MCALVFLAVTSLTVITVPSVTGQGAAKPSIPQFSVKLVDDSYDVPPSTTTTVDPYTGEKTVTTNPEYHVEQKKLEVTIKNPPFTPYTDTDGRKHRLYYLVESKGHFGDEWSTFWVSATFASNSVYTVVSPSYYPNRPVAGSQVDFRVGAVIGREHRDNSGDPDSHVSWVYDIKSSYPVFYDDVASSGWSDVLTFTVPGDVAPTPTQASTLPSPSSTVSDNSYPSVPDQTPVQTQPPDAVFANPFFLVGVGALIGGLFGGGVMAVVVVVFLRRRLKTSPAV